MARFSDRRLVKWAAAGGAELAYRAFNIGLDVHDVPVIRNGVYVGGFQNEAPYPGGSKGACTFSCELEGGAAADAAPVHNPLLAACGFAITTVGGISGWALGDTHPTTGDLTAADIKINLDGLESALENCVGNVSFRFVNGMFPIMDFNFIGNTPTGFAGATEVALGGMTAQSTPAPCDNMGLSIGPDTTPVGGLVVKSAILDLRNTLWERPDLNGGNGYSAPTIPKRDPLYRFQIEAPAIATLNLESMFMSRTKVDFEFTHNSGGGTNQILAVAASGYIAEYPKRIEDGDTVHYDLAVTQTAAADLLTMQWS